MSRIVYTFCGLVMTDLVLRRESRAGERRRGGRGSRAAVDRAQRTGKCSDLRAGAEASAKTRRRGGAGRVRTLDSLDGSVGGDLPANAQHLN